jgi:hypothetical protein
VRDFTRLQVSMDVLLDFQSLSSGRLLVRVSDHRALDYRDLWGTDKFWTHGF